MVSPNPHSGFPVISRMDSIHRQSIQEEPHATGGLTCNLLWFLLTRPLPFHYYHRGHSLPEASRVFYTSDEETVLFRSNLLLVFRDLTSSEVIYLQLWFASQPHVGGVSFSPSAATSVAGELISYFPFLMLCVHSALGRGRACSIRTHLRSSLRSPQPRPWSPVSFSPLTAQSPQLLFHEKS